MLLAYETCRDMIEDARRATSQKSAQRRYAKFYAYVSTQPAFLAYKPGFRQYIIAKADALAAVSSGSRRLRAALLAFQQSIAAIYTHRLLRQ
jgi:hypothetical protein